MSIAFAGNHRGASRSPHGEASVFGNVAANVSRQHAGLHFEHSAVTHLVTKDRVRYDGGLSLLVRLEKSLPAVLGQLARFTPDQEILRRQNLVVDQGEHDGIGDNRAKFLHQVQRQRWLAVPAHVKEAVIRVEAYGAERREAILQQDRVGEGKQRIDRIFRRPAIARFEVEASPGRGGLEHPTELAEVERRCLAFGAEKDGRIADAIDSAQQLGHVSRCRLITAAAVFVAVGRFVRRAGSQASHQQRALVADFGLNDRLGKCKRPLRVSEQLELVDAQEHVLGNRGHRRCDESPVHRHEDQGNAERRQSAERLRRNLHVAEDDDLLNADDRDTLDFLAVFFHDKMLAAFADVGALFLEIQHGPFAALRKHARDAGGGFFGGRQVATFQAIERFFRLANCCQGTAEASMSQLGRQRLRRRVEKGKFPDRSNGLQGFGPQLVVERHFDAAFATDIVEHAEWNRDAAFVFEQHRLGAKLNRVIVPEIGPAIVAAGPSPRLYSTG